MNLNWLDRVPVKVRELIIMLVAALLGWAADSVQTIDAPGYIIAMAGGIVGWAALNWTTLTRKYGVGQDDTNGD